jgi:hypothetical protein
MGAGLLSNGFLRYRMGILKKIVVLLLSVADLFAQEVSHYPEQIFLENIASQVSSPLHSFTDSSRFEAYSYLKQHSGLFSDIRHSHSALQVLMKRSKLGLSFSKNSEGDYLSFSRAYLHYSVAVPLSKRFTGSAGLNIGAVNFELGDHKSHIYGTDRAPDLDAGLSLRSSKEVIKITFAQVIKSSLTPLEYRYILQPHIQFYASKMFAMQKKTAHKITLRSFIYKDAPFVYNVSYAFLYKNISGGLGVTEKKGFTVFFQTRILELSNYYIDITGAYETTNIFVSTGQKIPIYQIGIQCKNNK